MNTVHTGEYRSHRTHVDSSEDFLVLTQSSNAHQWHHATIPLLILLTANCRWSYTSLKNEVGCHTFLITIQSFNICQYWLTKKQNKNDRTYLKRKKNPYILPKLQVWRTNNSFKVWDFLLAKVCKPKTEWHWKGIICSHTSAFHNSYFSSSIISSKALKNEPHVTVVECWILIPEIWNFLSLARNWHPLSQHKVTKVAFFFLLTLSSRGWCPNLQRGMTTCTLYKGIWYVIAVLADLKKFSREGEKILNFGDVRWGSPESLTG